MQNRLIKVAILRNVLKSFTISQEIILVKLQATTLLKKNCMTLLQLLTLFWMEGLLTD